MSVDPDIVKRAKVGTMSVEVYFTRESVDSAAADATAQAMKQLSL
jgi:hypothetical protein